ncbi:MAG: LytTR family DNA-binding domain-containing protein [Acidobacteriota bacterium]
MSGLRILIVEDEGRAAQRLVRLVHELAEDRVASLQVIDNLFAAEDRLAESPPDLLLLDLNLGGADGFELLLTAVAGAFHTIVVSAHAERAVEAFEHGVLDFVPKPYSRQRLARALERALGRDRSPTPARLLAIRKPGRIELIKIAEVSHLKAAGDYVEVTTEGGERHLHDKSLDRLASLLPARFVRIHRSWMVDLERLERVDVYPGGRYEARLRDGTTMPVSRSRWPELRRRMEGESSR